MSKYYGMVKGGSGAATRCGTAKSGIRTAAQSYGGSVIVELNDDKTGSDDPLVTIYLIEGSGNISSGAPRFRGSIDELADQLGKR
jgi:hypothetical protein